MPKLGALAIAKAHPLVFGAVLAVAIGIVVYQLVKPKKQKKLKYSNSSGGPDDDSGDDGSPRQSEMLFYDPETKSITNTAPRSNATDNNLRKRHGSRNSSSNNKKSPSEASPEKKEVVTKEIQPEKKGAQPEKKEAQAEKKETQPEKKEAISKEVQTESIDDNHNNDNTKLLPDKNIDSAMSVDEKVNKYFLKNISDADSVNSNDKSDSTSSYVKPARECECNCESCSTDSNDESNSTNSIVKPAQKCCGLHSAENCDLSDSDSSLSSWSNISPTEVNKMSKTKESRPPSACSVASIDSESSSFTVLSKDSELCRGCEENPVNTYTLPCNHRYMCSDCAPRIFRLFKRCKVCRARIERIVVEE